MRSAVSARPLRAPWVEMKYSSTDRPSRKLLLIGRGMISPRGFATRPRMPAIWRTCMTFPRAPEPTIISMGLNCFATSSTCMASVTWLVASVQISISFWRRSSSVMMPRSYCCSTFSASFSCLSRISGFAAGVRTSAIEIVRPARVEYSNPSSFSLSRLVRDLGLRVELDELADDLGDVALADQPVLEAEVRRERLVEEQATERRLGEDGAVAVAARSDAAPASGSRRP